MASVCTHEIASRVQDMRTARFETDFKTLIKKLGSRKKIVTQGLVLTDKRRIPLRSASVWTYTFFTTGFPRFLSIHGARGL
jgi:hypothetical protein